MVKMVYQRKDGKDGLPGKDGKDGIDGKDGLPGKDGKDGLPGRDGRDGLPGRDQFLINYLILAKMVYLVKMMMIEI